MAKGAQPGVHALVVGTSEYRYEHKGSSIYEKFADIGGAALGAGKFAKFLSEEYHDPLGREVLTVRVLLSPTKDEIPALVALGVRWLTATRDRVAAALRSWFGDCDKSADNITVLYAAGHGLTRAGSYSHVFLKAEGDEPSPFFFSLNLDVIKLALEYNYSQTKIFIADCCARPYLEPTYENGIVLEPKTERMKQLGRMGRKYDPLDIAGAGLGASAYALGASEGTMLSYVLEQLLSSAGELVRHPARPNNRYFAITQSEMTEQVEPIFRQHPRARHIRDGGLRISGQTVAGGLHRPTPPPEFHVEFVVKDPTQVNPVEVVIMTRGGVRLAAGTVSSSQRLALKLPAGIYVRESHAGRAEFEVDRPKRFDVLSWDFDLL